MSDIKAVNIHIATGDTRPIFKQIVDGIRMQIACGNLPVGSNGAGKSILFRLLLGVASPSFACFLVVKRWNRLIGQLTASFYLISKAKN